MMPDSSLVRNCSAARGRLVNFYNQLVFRGSAIALITAGLMSLAFMGFAGLVAS